MCARRVACWELQQVFVVATGAAPRHQAGHMKMPPQIPSQGAGATAREEGEVSAHDDSNSTSSSNPNSNGSGLKEWMPNRKAKGQWLGGPPGTNQQIKRAPRRRVHAPKDVEALLANGRNSSGPAHRTKGPKRPFLVNRPDREQSQKDASN